MFRYVFGQFQIELNPAANDRNAAGQGNWARAIPTYLSLLIFGFVYQLVLVYDALQAKNTIQVIGLVFMNVGILIYTGIQRDQINEAVTELNRYRFISLEFWDKINPVLIALPCLIALGTTILAFLAWQLYKEFGWVIYKQIGADLSMKRRFLIYQVRFFLSWSCWVTLTVVDLHCRLEIRLLFVCWLHCSILSSGG